MAIFFRVRNPPRREAARTSLRVVSQRSRADSAAPERNARIALGKPSGVGTSTVPLAPNTCPRRVTSHRRQPQRRWPAQVQFHGHARAQRIWTRHQRSPGGRASDLHRPVGRKLLATLGNSIAHPGTSPLGLVSIISRSPWPTFCVFQDITLFWFYFRPSATHVSVAGQPGTQCAVWLVPRRYRSAP